MPFRKIDKCTPEYQTILEQIAPPTKKLDENLWLDHYEIYLSDDKGTFFYRQYWHDVREWFLGKSELRVGKAVFQINDHKQCIGRKNDSKISVVEAVSNVPVTARMRTKVGRLLAELAPVLGKVKRGFKILITDKTKPSKPRPLSKLIQILNKISAAFYREQIIYCQPMFLCLMTDEELTSIKKHIFAKNGKGLTPLSILFFEVGFQQRISRPDTSLKPIPVPEGKAPLGALIVAGQMWSQALSSVGLPLTSHFPSTYSDIPKK